MQNVIDRLFVVFILITCKVCIRFMMVQMYVVVLLISDYMCCFLFSQTEFQIFYFVYIYNVALFFQTFFLHLLFITFL